jgi:hypothetical protein
VLSEETTNTNFIVFIPNRGSNQPTKLDVIKLTITPPMWFDNLKVYVLYCYASKVAKTNFIFLFILRLDDKKKICQ